MRLKMSSRTWIALSCLAAVSIATILRLTIFGQPTLPTITYSQFLERLETDRVASVMITTGSSGAAPTTCRLKDGQTVLTPAP